MAEIFEELREFITNQTQAGFESVHEIIKNTREWAYEKFERDDLLSEIKQFTAESFVMHQTEQSRRVLTTDCDRLDWAFMELNEQGIVARQDFSCCNNCGFTEIWEEVEDVEKQRPVEGYVFYTLQSTEQVIKTGQLMLAYGCIEDNSEAFQRIGNNIVAELRQAGLKASWGGKADHPIIVDGMVWHRRRHESHS